MQGYKVCMPSDRKYTHCKYRQISKAGIGHRRAWCDITGRFCMNIDTDLKNCSVRLIHVRSRRRLFRDCLSALFVGLLFLIFLTWLGRSWM